MVFIDSWFSRKLNKVICLEEPTDLDVIAL